MRIGLGSTLWSRGVESGHFDGIGHYTQELFRQFARSKSGKRVTPVVFGAAGASVLEGAPVVRLPSYGACALWSAIAGTGFPGTGPLQSGIDLFHATDHFTPRMKKVPVVATLMDAIPLSHPHWASQRARKVKNFLWKKSGHWADHVITISEFSRQQISHWFGIPQGRISVTSLGVDDRYFDRVAFSDLGASSFRSEFPERFFLFVGTLQPRKNIERIIDAHEALPSDVRASSPLLIAGHQGWGCESLVARLNAYEANSSVRWLRYVDDKTKRFLMQNALALVFPSLSEGFGLPVLEGFASQVPVITSNTTSLPEVAGDAAWLVDPCSVHAIADAMKTLARDDSIREQMISKGLERARSFTWKACAEQTEMVYAKVLGGR